ncbi:hypothetical protein, partial [Bosea sp. (in: a-proteobacteria)]|uniref:hypothetical protein n=1 Tax=Bosea sp. (in: a-proteobacteria) TaxID=1871050 RepID=UPI002FCB17CD
MISPHPAQEKPDRIFLFASKAKELGRTTLVGGEISSHASREGHPGRSEAEIRDPFRSLSEGG